MTIEQLARENVVTVGPDATVLEMAATMDEQNVGSVLVTEGDGLVGIVTDRDLGLRPWDEDDPTSLTATDVMTPDPVSVDPDTGLYDALQRAREANVRRLPVTDEGALVGIVTLDDFLVLLSGEFEAVSDIVQAGSPPY